jgi:glyoxylase-like metal-dependent hydrolase (beta-lactamase superfamily II)
MQSRRAFLASSLSLSTLPFPALRAQTAPSLGSPTLPEPGFRRVRMGAMEVITINDGVLRRPLGADFVRGVPLDEVKALLASQNLPTDYIDVPYTVCLIVLEGKRYLFDTGFADNGPPTTGRLVANLAAVGFSPADIDHVVISHFHGDHINGLRRKDGSLVYPKAQIHVPVAEHAFWTDSARAEAAPAGMKPAFAAVQRVFGNLPAGQLLRFESGAEVVPGIRSMAAYGHSPGHTIFIAGAAGQSVAFVADITNVPALFARRPDWAVVFDMDPEMARTTRRRVFDMLVREKMPAVGFHFPFPAIGTMEATSDNGYQFRPMA